MCVAVSLLPGTTLTPEEIWKMGNSNGDGVGIAWVDPGLNQVRWYKTATNYKVKNIANIIDHHINSPRLVHFRLSTVGGVRPDLCHPFAIDAVGTCAPVGVGNKVMIHNGHWHRYKELLDLMEKEGLLPDKGPWSDTRLIAYLASDDIDWLQIIGGRVATLDGDGQLVHFGDWTEYREGMRVSNTLWTTEKTYKTGGYSGFNKWPGWDNSWDGKSHEQYEADKRAKDEARKSEIRRVIAERDEANNVKKGKTNGKERQKGPGETGQKEEPIPGHHGGATRHVGPGGGVGDPQEGGEDSQSGGLPGKRRGGRPGGIDKRPWRNPATGRVYVATEEGRMVEVTADYFAAGGAKVAGGLATEDRDNPAWHKGGWANSVPTESHDGTSGHTGDGGGGGDTALHGRGASGRGSLHKLTSEEWEALQEWEGVILEEIGGEGG